MPAKGKGTKERTRNIRVVIADDHRTFAEALRAALTRERGIRVTAIVDHAAGAVEIVRSQSPDILLITVEGMDAVEAIREIRGTSPGTRVVVLTGTRDDTTMARAVEAGAAGYLPTTRPVKDVASSIRAAHRGKPLMDPVEMRLVLARTRRKRRNDASQRERLGRLTPRETEVLRLMADGLSSSRIAEELDISPHTLRTHVQNVLVKLRVHSKMEALALAIRYGKVHSRATRD